MSWNPEIHKNESLGTLFEMHSWLMFPFELFLDVFTKDDKLFKEILMLGFQENIAIGTADQCFNQIDNSKNHATSPQAI